VILGNNGSGKSFLAKEIAAVTGLPLIHLDAAFWTSPGWEMPPEDVWREKMKGFVAGERWILDGIVSFGDTMAMRFEAADMVLLLDVNRVICLAGVLRRRGKTRSDTAAGHEKEEKFDRGFWGLCKGIWRFKGTREKRILRFHEQYPGTPFAVIKGRRGLRRLIKEWKNE